MKKRFCLKPISILLTVILMFGILAASLYAFADDDSVTFTVGTDMHIENTLTELEINYPESELYFQASGSGNLYDQAASLTEKFLNDSADEGASFILIAGDLTRNGNEAQHRFTASLLSDFESKTGIQVYVVPGNHDYFRSTREEFKEYYHSFGYDGALAVHDSTASYTADVAGDYRLIAVDSNDPGNDGDGITASLLNWIEEQANAAARDGKKIIYMMHHPLLEHLYMGKLLMKDFIVRGSERIAEKFTRWGIEYVFTGHEHGNDIASFTGSNGKKVYDILTTALSSYPLEYRRVTLSEGGADIKMKKIGECDTSSLIPGYTSAQREMLETDYEGYAYGIFRYSVEKKILRYTSPDFIKNKLKAGDGALSDQIDILFNAINDALNMPIYNSGDGAVSIEKLAKSKGVTIPRSDYGSLIKLASALVANHYYGDENLPSASNTEAEIFIKGVNTGLEYILSRAGRENLNLLLEIIGAQSPLDTNELGLLFRAVGSEKENSYAVAEKLLYPLTDKFLIDSDVSDRDVFIPGQGSPQPRGLSAFATFINKISEFIKRLFSFIFPLQNRM